MSPNTTPNAAMATADAACFLAGSAGPGTTESLAAIDGGWVMDGRWIDAAATAVKGRRASDSGANPAQLQQRFFCAGLLTQIHDEIQEPQPVAFRVHQRLAHVPDPRAVFSHQRQPRGPRIMIHAQQ